jgi:hypothetical protein
LALVTNGSTYPPDAALPSARVVWDTFGLVVLFSVGSAFLFVWTDPDLHLDLENFAVFAPIYAAAQAIERLLEPIAARYRPSTELKVTLKTAQERKLTARNDEALQTAAQAEQVASDALRKRRSERALLYFALASFFSLALTGALGLGILEAMASEPLKEYLGAIDVALTGLVIAAGTKPLHDLITRLEKAKENADSSAQPTPPAPTPVIRNS